VENKAIYKDDQERYPVYAQDVRDLDKMKVIVLRVSHKAPGKFDQILSPDSFKTDPETCNE